MSARPRAKAPRRPRGTGEAPEERRARARRIHALLAKDFPAAECALVHADAYQLLVATILSAQCTDARVNLVTPEVFRRWPDAAALARAPQGEVEEAVRTTGFFRNKAKNLREMAKRVVERHGGAVPDEMDALTELPGVARKTANVVLGTWFGRNEGIAVDTHVTRVSGRLALTAHDDPAKIEADLCALLPREEWTDFGHRIILHGRNVCFARRPACPECSLRKLCPSRQDVPPAERILGGRGARP